jgi:hypothetical protein
MYPHSSVTFSLNDDRTNSIQPPMKRGRSLLDRLIEWLLTPIDFPGKWPVNELPPERYNKESGSGTRPDKK